MTGILITKAIATIQREMNKERFVKRGNQQWSILCPFHNDTSPSLQVNLFKPGVPVGIFKCWSCGEGGNWNKLAAKKGWKQLSSNAYKQVVSIAPNFAKNMDEMHQDLMSQDTGGDWLKLQPDLAEYRLFDVESDFRHINRQLLEDMGCKRYIDLRNGDTFVIMPVNVKGNTVGLVNARMTPQEKLSSYINSPGRWVRTKGLLGYDLIEDLPRWKSDRIVFLGEGPRDALLPIQKGFPYISILGSQNWSNEKAKLIAQLSPKLVVSVMDNDKAGRKAGRFIAESFSKGIIPFYKFVLPKEERIGKKLDPGKMPAKLLSRIYELAQSKLDKRKAA